MASHSTQRNRILALLIDARGSWVPLPDILALGIAQYNTRIFELRRMGFIIESRREGQHTFFREIPSIKYLEFRDRRRAESRKESAGADLLFDISADRSYKE